MKVEVRERWRKEKLCGSKILSLIKLETSSTIAFLCFTRYHISRSNNTGQTYLNRISSKVLPVQEMLVSATLVICDSNDIMMDTVIEADCKWN